MSKRENVVVIKNLRYVDGEEEHETEIGEPEVFKTEVARVGVTYGATVNMGNYNSARVDVHVSVPCYVEDLDKAHKFAEEFASKKLQESLIQLRDSSAKKVGATVKREKPEF